MADFVPLASRRLRLTGGLRSSTLLRLARVEGQVRGIQRMVEQDRSCPELLALLSATSEALRRVEHIVMRSVLTESMQATPTQADHELTAFLALVKTLAQPHP